MSTLEVLTPLLSQTMPLILVSSVSRTCSHRLWDRRREDGYMFMLSGRASWTCCRPACIFSINCFFVHRAFPCCCFRIHIFRLPKFKSNQAIQGQERIQIEASSVDTWRNLIVYPLQKSIHVEYSRQGWSYHSAPII